MNNFSIVIPHNINETLTQHLIREDGQEDLCFATYHPSSGKNRFSGIMNTPILPLTGEREVHGNVSFNPSFLERSLKISFRLNQGLVFLHSHPFPGWQGMSNDDIVAEKRICKAAFTITKLPLIGLTVSSDGEWSARVWIKDCSVRGKYNKIWCESVRIVGKKLSITFNESILPPKINKDTHVRTISAWGLQKQKELSQLKVCIVGLGSVGSIVAEILARMGVSYIKLIDFDNIEKKNLDRTLNIYLKDIGKSKVSVIANRIKKSANNKYFKAIPINENICKSVGFYEALDCDVIFCCVDRPWARQTLNFIAYAHLIPVIDGGIKIRTNKENSKMIGADWRAHIVGSERACLECIGQYNTSHVGLEKDGFLDTPSYIEGLPYLKDMISSENVFPFSTNVASLEVLQFLNMFIAPSAISDIGQQMYHFVTGTLDNDHINCKDNCFFKSIEGKGDNSGISIV